MQCNGKCHLAKELKQDEEKKSKSNVEQVEIIMICEDSKDFSIEFSDFVGTEEEQVFNYLDSTLDDKFGTIFHPPIFIL